MFIFLFSIHFLTCTVGGGGPVKLKKYAPKIGGAGPHTASPPYAPRLRCLYFSSKLEEESPQWYMTGMRHAL